MAIPRKIKRHVHPRAQPPKEPGKPTGVDYLGLVRKRREQELQKRIDYRNLPRPPADDHDHNHNHKEQAG